MPWRASHELVPCGDPSAARRHYRRGEPLDPACKRAEARAWADGGAGPARYERWRERYADARAAGLGSRDATRYSRGGAETVDQWRREHGRMHMQDREDGQGRR